MVKSETRSLAFFAGVATGLFLATLLLVVEHATITIRKPVKAAEETP